MPRGIVAGGVTVWLLEHAIVDLQINIVIMELILYFYFGE